MKKIVLSAALIASFASADFIGLNVGAAYWGTKTTGDFQYKGSQVDLERDLNYGDTTSSNFIWASFEHPVPVLPNIKIQHTMLDDSATSTATFQFDNKNYTGSVQSSYNLDQTDFILYYEILDNWVSLDLGANFKYLDGNVQVRDSANIVGASNKDFQVVIPMLYTKAQFEIPTTGFSIETDLSYIGYSGSQFYDFKAGLSYETSYGLGLTAGYRAERIKIDDISDVNADMKIDGMYAGMFFHF